MYYGAGEKRQRGGRRNKKKKKRDAEDNLRETDWDELYDPARPTNVEEYLRSGERVREVREWKAVLYAHRRQERRSEDGSGSEEERESTSHLFKCSGDGYGLMVVLTDLEILDRFAPPPSLTFAPPPMSPPRAAAPVPNDATGDDAYARRLALSGMAPPPPPPPPPGLPPPQPATTATDAATISRAPVRYSPPPPPPPDAMDVGAQDDYDPEVDYSSIALPTPTTTTELDQEQRTARPGQKDFARRLMTKYGWTKGTGLGASASGITSALRVQVEKRRRKPDSEGGGFAEPGGRGRIIAPKAKSKPTPQNNTEDGDAGAGAGAGPGQGKFGKMSVVVVLDRMLDNMADLESEVEAGLGQEIGEECGERYGRVERIVVDVEGRRVFIKFVEGVSALRVSLCLPFHTTL
jgi:splicing factor 45